MATTNLGKVSVTPKGEWSAAAAYDRLDIVTYAGGSYLSKQDVPAGTALSNSAYWLLIAEKGDKGNTGTLSAGTTTTGLPGTDASVVNSGTSTAAVFDFTIPRGDKGDKGDTGTITVGTTTTGQPGTDASVVNSGSTTAAVFDFTIPRGNTGNGIESVEKISSSGLVDTYRLLFTDGDYFDYEVTNASGGEWGNISGDIDDQTDLSNALDEKADAVEITTSGDFVTFSDGADMPVQNLTVGIDPIQAGTGDPAPDNVRLITGWTGMNLTRCRKNLLDLQHADLGTKTRCSASVSDDVLTVTCTEAGTVWLGSSGSTLGQPLNYESFTTPCQKGETLSISLSIQVYKLYIYELDKNKNMIKGLTNIATDASNATYTASTDNCSYLAYRISFDEAGVIDETYSTTIQIEKSSAPTAYEPYQGTTYNISWQSSAGTVYGGSLDVTTGVLTVDKVFITVTASDGVSTYLPRVRIATGSAKPPSGANPGDVVISSYLKSVGNNTTRDVNDYGISPTSSGPSAIYIRIPDFTTVAQYDAYLEEHPLQVVYKLYNPQTYQLTPLEVATLLGYNTIFADTGEVAVQYRADTKMYIDQKIDAANTATRAMITGIEQTMTASKNYNAGDLIIVGDTLYKATTTIASGSDMTDYVTQVTLAEWILSLIS